MTSLCEAQLAISCILSAASIASVNIVIAGEVEVKDMYKLNVKEGQ
mgnify:CR=1 FL=1